MREVSIMGRRPYLMEVSNKLMQGLGGHRLVNDEGTPEGCIERSAQFSAWYMEAYRSPYSTWLSSH